MAERRNTIFFESVLAITLVLSVLSRLASAATIQLPASSAPFNSLSATSENNRYCTVKETWLGSHVNRADCISAINYFYKKEVAKYNNEDFEFVSTKLNPSNPKENLGMKTPRKYTWGSCTLAIATLGVFQDGDLPGVEGAHSFRDVTSFYDIWVAARRIESVCLLHSETTGWAVEGARDSLGVFLWGSDSEENKRVQGNFAGDEPRWGPQLGANGSASVGAMVNGTANVGALMNGTSALEVDAA